MQSSSQIITDNKPTPIFYRPDAFPVAQPTMSKALNGKNTDRLKMFLRQSKGLLAQLQKSM